MSDLEDTMLFHLRAAGLPEPIREFRFAKPIGRQWRFDFAFPEHKVALEIEGGTWSNGRHVRGAGYAEDIAKYNAAVLLGWRVLRATGAMVKDGTALQGVEALLCGEQSQPLTLESRVGAPKNEI